MLPIALSCPAAEWQIRMTAAAVNSLFDMQVEMEITDHKLKSARN